MKQKNNGKIYILYLFIHLDASDGLDVSLSCNCKGYEWLILDDLFVNQDFDYLQNLKTSYQHLLSVCVFIHFKNKSYCVSISWRAILYPCSQHHCTAVAQPIT